jgi:hypothetical protein
VSVPARLVPYRGEVPVRDHKSLLTRLADAWVECKSQVRAYHWWIFTAGAIIAFVLGCVGWWKLQCEGHPTAGDAAFVAYWSLKDFLWNSPSQQVIPWELNVARFLAPLVAGWATYSALAAVYRDRFQQMRIPLLRRHVVICGLGKYVGTIFLRHLDEKKIPVVVIEQDMTNPNIELCRRLGVPVVIGDAQRRNTLQAAGAQHARRVLVVTDDDAVNTQIAETWRKLPRRRLAQAGCLARISDPDFCSMLRLPQTRSETRPWVDFFNIDEIGAREIVDKYSADQPDRHILVAHLDPLGVWLVWHAARAWYEHGDQNTPLVVTIVDRDPDESVAALQGQHPELKKHCEFTVLRATAQDIHERLPAHHRDSATPPIGRAYVTAYQDHQAFTTALKLHDELRRLDPPVPVVLALSRPRGISDLLADAGRSGSPDGIEVFSTMDKACSVEVIEGGSLEPLAEAIHERWRAEQIRSRKPAPQWGDLDESRKASSRGQARDIGAKLDRIGCEMALLADWDATDFVFRSEEVEDLAVDEHERWYDERIAAKWTLIDMPTADDPEEVTRLVEEAKQNKQSPYLIPWDQLQRNYPDMAELDRIFVRDIPHLLAGAGLQVVRRPGSVEDSSAVQQITANGLDEPANAEIAQH